MNTIFIIGHILAILIGVVSIMIAFWSLKSVKDSERIAKKNWIKAGIVFISLAIVYDLFVFFLTVLQ